MAEQKKRDFSGPYPIIPFRVRRNFPRPPRELVAKFARFLVPDISDLVGRMYTMDGIRSLGTPAPKLVGPAITVKVPPGDNMMVKRALLHVTPGDVIVVDAQGFTGWGLGGFGMLMPSIRNRGLQGLVVNGAYRDVTQVEVAEFPIYAKALAPYSGPKRGPGEINVPVCCGGVVVHPGDVVVGDADGVVVVPQDYVGLVAEKLALVEHKDKPEDWTDEYLNKTEAGFNEYFDQVFKEKGGVFLD